MSKQTTTAAGNGATAARFDQPSLASPAERRFANCDPFPVLISLFIKEQRLLYHYFIEENGENGAEC